MNKIRRKVDQNTVNPPILRWRGQARFTEALSPFDVPETWSQEANEGRTVFSFDYLGGPEKSGTESISASAEIVYGLSSGRICEIRVENGLLPSDTLLFAIAAVEAFRNRHPEIRSRSDAAVRRILGDRKI